MLFLSQEFAVHFIKVIHCSVWFVDNFALGGDDRTGRLPSIFHLPHGHVYRED